MQVGFSRVKLTYDLCFIARCLLLCRSIKKGNKCEYNMNCWNHRSVSWYFLFWVWKKSIMCFMLVFLSSHKLRWRRRSKNMEVYYTGKNLGMQFRDSFRWKWNMNPPESPFCVSFTCLMLLLWHTNKKPFEERRDLIVFRLTTTKNRSETISH